MINQGGGTGGTSEDYKQVKGQLTARTDITETYNSTIRVLCVC